MKINNLFQCAIGIVFLSYGSLIFAATTVTTFRAPTVEAPTISDSDLNSNVLNTIGQHKAISSLNVSISTHSGIVSLTGNVRTIDDASKFIIAVESTTGVKDVDTSALTLLGGTQLPQDVVTADKIKGTYIREKLFSDPSAITIDVTVTNGIVYLSGAANSRTQLLYAVTLARTVPGVTTIMSQVRVNATVIKMAN